MNEAIAIAVFQQQRMKEYLQPLFALADPEKAGDLIKQYKFSIFPEDKYDDVRYHKKAAEYFERMRNTNLRIHLH